MKIVLVHNTYQQPGGEDTVYRCERDMLREAGHQIVEYCRSNHDVSKYVSIGQLSLAKRTIWASDTRQQFRELLLREKPDIVQVYNTFVMISPSLYWACREAQVPVVQSLQNYRLICPGGIFLRDGKVCEECVPHGVWRGVRYGCYHKSRRATAVVSAMLATHRLLGTWSRLIDYYVVPTEFGRQKFVAGGVPAEKIVVKPNSIHPDPGEGGKDRSYALFVGRLSPEKGLRTLLEAWARLRTAIPLHIVGDGPLRGEQTEFVQKHGLSGICFRGNLQRSETLAAMKGACYLVVPSESYEGMPLAVLEAYAAGTPVISSRMGTMQELIRDGKTGLHFTPFDADDLARKAEWAWVHPKEMGAMGKQARHEYESKYTAATNYRTLMDIYQRAIRGYGPKLATVQKRLADPAQNFGSPR
jgi:glycosyltransferase involved in cell wall biosynthesis